MYFKQLKDEETSTYTYVLADEKAKEAIIIDSVKEHVDEYVKLIESLGFKLKYVLDTHVHADHITGSGLLREKLGAETVLGEHAKADCVSIKVKDGDALQFGKHEIKVIHTPGHTPCHVTYQIKNRLFTGDALLIEGCGRTDFQGGSAKQLWHSITEKLFKLTPEFLVYPGHDYNLRCVSSIQQEMDRNPRFKDQTEASFIKLMDNLNLPDPKKIHEAVPANQACGMK
jgi:sulfur dioxygenase